MNELELKSFDYIHNLAEQRELFKDCFPETNGDPIQGDKHYFWKFHSFPSEIKSWEYAAWFDKEIVGYYAALPYIYKIGNEVVNVGMVCDVMTSSKFRGKGIFTKLGHYSTDELAAAHIPFIMGYPIRKEVIPGHLKVGWKSPFTLPLYMKFIRLNTLLKSKKIEFIVPFANLFIGLYNWFTRTKTSSELTYTLSENIEDVKEYEVFTKEWNDSVPNALIKDFKFAKWRYSAPERKYNFLSIYDKKGKMIGFVSFRKIFKEGVPSYGILDYMVLPNHSGCYGLVNKVLSNCAKTDNVEIIMTMMSKYSASKYQLLKNGFFKSPYVFQLIIKNLTNEFYDETLFKEKNWHLMWVDSDDL